MAQFLSFPIRSTKLSMSVEVKEHIAAVASNFQQIDIYDTFAFGRVLFLDGHVQLAELDERCYHEALVHIPMISIDSPRRALVVGGGDGGVLRELCKHGSLEQIDMVEIDSSVVETCRAHLPFVSDGSFEDPRVRLLIEDAFAFLRRVNEPYDLIVMDVTDVYEEEDGALSEQLFSGGFYADCLRALSEKGIIVTQADNQVFCPYSLEGILHDFRNVFPAAGSYQALVPSFGGFSAFAWASKAAAPKSTMPESQLPLSYLNDTTWQLAFSRLPFDHS